MLAVIMAVYKMDVVDYFKMAIESVLKQDVSLDLYLCIDGEIPAEFDGVIRRYESSYPNVIVLRQTVNRGLAYSLNALIDLIEQRNIYDYVARMDSDDICREGRFLLQLRFMADNQEVDISGGACSEFGSTYALKYKCLPLRHADLRKAAVLRSPLIHPTVIFRMNVFRDGHRYPEDTVLAEDMALWYKLILAGYVFANVSEVLLDYRASDQVLIRRGGVAKAFSDFRMRIAYAFRSRLVTPMNVIKLLARLIIQMSPAQVKSWAYKNYR